MTSRGISLFSACWLLIAGGTSTAESEVAKATPEQIEFYEKSVRPLLVKHCYACHGENVKKIKGGLSLAHRDGWLEGGDSGPAIVPGDPDDSLLMKAIRYEDFMEMPPEGRLPAATVAVFEKWIKMGAPAPAATKGPKVVASSGIDIDAGRKFWAFQPPKSHHPPQVRNAAWPASTIDRFVLAKLEDAKLSPNGDADPRALLRRVYYVLAGLPPTPEQIKAYLADKSPTALERVVDELIASPRFGETWGRHWLDVARYADSNGNDFNATFHDAYRYRNYVIACLNEDMPFDQFVREQLAGDLLPYERDQQRERQIIATGFLAVGTKMLSERDKEKLILDVADEQIDTIGRAFLGMTLGCARCHDHKFDPIPTADYYALAGILSSTEVLQGESQRYVSDLVRPKLPMSAEHARQLDEHEKALKPLQTALAGAKKALAATKKPGAAKTAGGEPGIRQVADLPGVVVDNDQAKLVGAWKASTHAPRYVGAGYIHDEKKDKGQKSVVYVPNLPRSGEYEVRMSYSHSEGRDRKVPVTIRHAAGEAVVYVDEEQAPNVDGIFHKLGRFRFNAGKSAKVTIGTTGTTEYVIADAVQFVPVSLLEGPALAKEQETNQAAVIAELEAKIKALEAEIKQLQAKAPPPAPRALGVQEAPKPADCAVCIRGEHRNRGQLVERGFLQVLSDGDYRVKNRYTSGRVELADWIASPKNPLTARVIVNRVWMNVFGEGLVRTPDNFGLLGELPTHPELLDDLSVRFVQGGWSIKTIVREMVLSRTFRLSSEHREDAYLADAENRLLWRANRRRLTAEAIHDSMLSVSGLLDTSPGGPVVSHFGTLVSNNSTGAVSTLDYDAHLRRAVYLPVIRSQLPPMMTVFDFADPDVVTGKRPVTNVPAQALLLLNGAKVTRSAEALAKRLLEDKSLSDEARIQRAYELVLGRPQLAPEQAKVLAFVDDQMRTGVIAEGGNAEKRSIRVWTRFVQTLFASTEFRWMD